MTSSESGKAILQATSKPLYTEEYLNSLKDNYIKKNDCDCFGEIN